MAGKSGARRTLVGECGEREGMRADDQPKEKREPSSSHFLRLSSLLPIPVTLSLSSSPFLLRIAAFHILSRYAFSLARVLTLTLKSRLFAISLSHCGPPYSLRPFNSIATPFYNAGARAARTEVTIAPNAC